MALDHNRLIRDAARRHLAPLGIMQRGRSRTWIDDRGWWLITVEFQPSDSGRGTYLNVGGSWLWYPKDSNSFDLGYRVEGFRDLRGVDASQTCDELAQRAADEVRAFRMRIPDVEAAARELESAILPGWPNYHAAVAAALMGRIDQAHRRFEALEVENPTDVAWVQELRKRASFLKCLLQRPDAFLREITDSIQYTRRALRLPDWSGEFTIRSSG